MVNIYKYSNFVINYLRGLMPTKMWKIKTFPRKKQEIQSLYTLLYRAICGFLENIKGPHTADCGTIFSVRVSINLQNFKNGDNLYRCGLLLIKFSTRGKFQFLIFLNDRILVVTKISWTVGIHQSESWSVSVWTRRNFFVLMNQQELNSEACWHSSEYKLNWARVLVWSLTVQKINLQNVQKGSHCR